MFLSRWKLHKCATTRGVGGAGIPCPFLKVGKSALIWREKGPDSVFFWVKFSIQNVFLEYLRRKALFSRVLNEFFIEVLLFHKTSPALKSFWLHTWWQKRIRMVVSLHLLPCKSSMLMKENPHRKKGIFFYFRCFSG